MRKPQRAYHVLASFSLLFAFCVVVLGAYVRLTDAGLGCPDWPGCFGELLAPLSDQAQQAAQRAFPHLEVESGKAWREMIHRYAAATLGLLILALAFFSVFQKSRSTGAVVTSVLLLIMVGIQGWLGKLTVDRLLEPQIVVAHLMGGMVILGLLRWLSLQTSPRVSQRSNFSSNHRLLALVGLLVLAGQIFLGGWTSANYAQYGCPDFPTCQDALWPEADFAGGFDFSGKGMTNYEGGVLQHPARVAIHFVHRLGAIIATIVLLMLITTGYSQKRVPMLRRVSLWVAFFLALQLGVAIAMVLQMVPLSLAVAHNAVAALLWLSVVTYVFVVWNRCE